MSAVGTAMVCPFYQCDRAQHSLVKQAEAQGALTAGAVAEVQAGGATRAPLHPDEGLDLGAHLELHYGLDQWPVGTTAVRMGAVDVYAGTTAVCLSSLSLLLVPIIPPTSGVPELSGLDLTTYGCQVTPHCLLACLFRTLSSWLLAVPPGLLWEQTLKSSSISLHIQFLLFLLPAHS